MTDAFAPTPRSRVRRKPDRAAYDEQQVFAILDAAVLAHVGYVIDGQPFVTPTTFWREGRKLYWHGSAASRMVRAQASGLPVCVTVSHVDGLVLARSGIAHSMNYRSVMAFGRARLIEGLEAQRAAMNAFIDRLYPSRSATLRPGSDSEIRQMSVVEMIIEEASAKQRAAGVNRMAEDEGWDAWSGVIPIETRIGAPMADAVQSAGAAADLGPYVEGARLDEALTRAARE
ncbi:pyridoxamine 5'-phosphate oxidase family protein [Phenylobacterium sp.]|jgi:nitroimidazol reductase NimA-like FMN-containing flavoprotein (pyridoxamine 5'-phosphate oxidase superfamily)|uniref:pyridoxamine 5'-phosphate oxidase family protein n=1 Tax=Phenylobacterium sp. TaxID=1871053 RepID=UPI0035B4924F